MYKLVCFIHKVVSFESFSSFNCSITFVNFIFKFVGAKLTGNFCWLNCKSPKRVDWTVSWPNIVDLFSTTMCVPLWCNHTFGLHEFNEISFLVNRNFSETLILPSIGSLLMQQNIQLVIVSCHWFWLSRQIWKMKCPAAWVDFLAKASKRWKRNKFKNQKLFLWCWYQQQTSRLTFAQSVYFDVGSYLHLVNCTKVTAFLVSQWIVSTKLDEMFNKLETKLKFVIVQNPPSICSFSYLFSTLLNYI